MACQNLSGRLEQLAAGGKSPCTVPLLACLTMIRALTLQRPGADNVTLSNDLQAAGIHIIGAVQRNTVVLEVIRQSPDLLVCVESHPDEALFQQLGTLHAYAEVAVLLFTTDSDAQNIDRALQAGVHAYVVNGYAASRLRPLVHLARARRAHDAALRSQLEQVTQRFEERKQVDRAKGILMATRKLPEEEAFKVLRDLAMQGGQRLGEAAQQLIESARSAADINRSGQLRMLSQRLVLLVALHGWPGQSKAQVAAAKELLNKTVLRTDALVEALGKDLSAATFGDLQGALAAAWRALRGAIKTPGPAATHASMLATDVLAEELLLQSHRLTDALESAGAVLTMQVINVAGRQRMLSQRLAKLAVLFALGVTPAGESVAAVQRQFEQAQALLRVTPLSTPDIRQLLEAADRHWPTLLTCADRVREFGESVRHSGGVASVGDELAALAQASDDLLQVLESLTSQYESSVQVLLG